MNDLVSLILLLSATGAAAGVISGLLGVGGGIILVPAFHYVFDAMGYHPDQLMQICVATSTGTIVVTSWRAVGAHRKHGAVDTALIRAWGPAIIAGAIAGVLAATVLRSRDLQLVFGVIGIALGLYMLAGRKSWQIATTLPGRALGAIYAVVIGFFSALMGIGGGAFAVPLLTAHGVAPHRAVATAPGLGLLISIPAFAIFLMTGWDLPGRPPMTLGYVNLPALGLIMVISTLSVPVGVRLAHRLAPRQLRLVFAVVSLVLAGNMLGQAIWG